MAERKLYQALFEPQTIALIGASGDARKNTSRPQRFLEKHGYTGKVIPINPGRSEIFGEKAYPDVASVPEPIDHAFIMVPADAVAAALEQCAEKKVTVATVYSDGFAETGAEGRRKQERLLAIARASGMRLVGPNCIGLVSTEPSCALSVNAVLEFADIRKGPLAIVSQSGSMIGGLMSRGLGRGVGFSKLISVGNEADLGVGEISDLLVDDPHTGTILLFMETIRDADHLARAARRAYAAGKRIIVYKLGRSEVGQDLAASHTGAMAGGDEMAEAFFRANGMLRVDVLETLFELPALVNGQNPAQRHRIAVMTTTGGGAASVVDRMGTFGLEVVAPSDEVVANLAQKNIRISKARLTDLTLAGAKKEIYSAVLNELLASDHCDLVLAVVGSSAQFQPQIAIEPIVEAERRGKPLAVFLAPHAEQSLTLLADAGIAGFRTPESCADAIRAWRNWAPPVERPVGDAARLAAAAALLGTPTLTLPRQGGGKDSPSARGAQQQAQSPSLPVAESPSLPSAESPSLPGAESPSLPSAESPSLPSAEFPSLPSAESFSLPSAESPSPLTGEGRDGGERSLQLNEYDACRVFAALGVPQAESDIITSPEQRAAVAFPVVAKVLSPDVLHKTDAGGVVLHIADAAALKSAAEKILSQVRAKYPAARVNGILVQRMERGLAEVIVGYKRDPQVGPIVMLGIGGVLAEIYRDFALRLAPVTAQTAREMIEEVKGLATIRGYRGMPRGDLAALAEAVSAFSQLAALETVQEAEINPLIVKREGESVVAVDGLIVCG